MMPTRLILFFRSLSLSRHHTMNEMQRSHPSACACRDGDFWSRSGDLVRLPISPVLDLVHRSIYTRLFIFAMDVFMMIRRQKLTLFIDAKESSTVLELKKMIEGITKVPANGIRLIVDSTKQPMDDDNQTLSDCGLSGVIAKAYSPVLLYLCHRKAGSDHEWEPIDVTEL